MSVHAVRNQHPTSKVIVRRVRDFLRKIRRNIADTAGLPLTWLAAHWLNHIRRAHRIERTPNTRQLFQRIGIYPLIDHYYEPLIDRTTLDTGYRHRRSLPGIDWNEDNQWHLLDSFEWSHELHELKANRTNAEGFEYYLHNGYFGPGDADIYYSLIRQLKPDKIIEIGSGHSTRLAVAALAKNAATSESNSSGKLICVEPYRNLQWFTALGVEHHAQPIEEIDRSLFAELTAGDIVFIDSSHIVRPQGDILYLLQQVIPCLPKGVFIHIHDIFSPLDYPNEWIIDRMHFWNEQYMVEAFLAYNKKFRVAASVQYLMQSDLGRLEKVLPLLHKRRSDIGTTSIWLETL